MVNYYTHKVLMIGIAAVFLIYGCAPSSNTLRYKHTVKNNIDTTARFTSKDLTDKVDQNINEENSDENDSEEFPEESSIDISSIMQNLNSQRSSNSATQIDNTSKEKMLMEIIKYLDTPYRFGGTSKDGIDCSAFTQTIFENTFKVPLLRTAREQFTQGYDIEDRKDLQFGDLVFFNTRRRVKPGHVGVYIGDNLFAHSSSKNGVMVSSMDHEYYSNRFMGARRVEVPINSKL